MRESSEPRRISTRRRSSGVPTKMYVAAAFVGDPADRCNEIVAFFLEEVDAEHAREPTQRGKLRCFLVGRRPTRPPHPDRVDLGAETLGGAPGAAEDPL